MLNDRPVWVTIPTVGYSDLLIPLLNEIERDRRVDKILLTVNLEDLTEPISDFFRFAGPHIEVIETWPLGKSIHHGWNTAIQMARKQNAWLAVFNDDIRLLTPNAISNVAGVLAANPTYAIVGLNYTDTPESADSSDRPLRQVHGSYRHGGVGGWAWVCDPHKVGLVPDELVWWYGDDHLIFSAEQSGYSVGIANHVLVEHHNEATASSGEHNWTHDAKDQDRVEFHRLWPGK